MNITGIRPYEAFGHYTNRIEYQAPVLEGETTVEPKGDYLDKASESEKNYASSRARQTETSYDYAMKYDAKATYDLKGADSDLNKLDIMAELPKAHRDEALKQYQVFVGGKTNQLEMNQDTSSRQLENFSL